MYLKRCYYRKLNLSCFFFVAGSAREGGLVWRGCSAGCDAEDGAAGALAENALNPGDKVPTSLGR